MQPVRLYHNVYAMPVALEDAAHLGLSEDEVARKLAIVVRDPAGGTKGQRYWSRNVGAVTLRYGWELAGGELEVYLLRIVEKSRPPRNFAEARDVAKRLIVGTIQKKLNDALAGN